MKVLITIILLNIFFIQLQSQQFQKLASSPITEDGGDSRAVNLIDYDNDGDLDLYITNGPSAGQNNFFYENQGSELFIKIDSLSITSDLMPSDGSSWGDINNDGLLDLFVANWYGKNNLLYLNNGDKTFFEFIESPIHTDGGFSETGAWGDYNNDGYLDLVVANSDGDLNNFAYSNNSDESFSKINDNLITTGSSASRNIDWADYDNDGDIDLFVANENNQKNNLFINDNNGNFTEISEGPFLTDRGNSFGSSWGDYDNDGDLDLFVANWSNQNNFLYRNNGDGTFESITTGIVVNDKGFSIGTGWGDIDNDGDLDLFVANGFSTVETNNFLYLNNGDGTFKKDTSIVTSDGGWTYGSSFGDINRDGYLDLVVAKCFNANENNSVFLNSGGSNHWITLKMEGNVSNNSAIGTIVRIKAEIEGISTWQMRHVTAQTGYCGQNLELNFGLGNATIIDSVIIQWSSGQKEVIENLDINQFKYIKEKVPQNFVRPNFKVNKRLGFVETILDFVDLSITDINNPITSWEWDFNSDGISDNSEQNTTWIYNEPGVYDVSLKVSNGIEAFEKTILEYVKINRIPGTPVIMEFSPIFNDTLVEKGTEIIFSISAIDTTEYPISYDWKLNGSNKSTDSSYSYRASAFGQTPRTDTVYLEVSNGFNVFNREWLINVVDDITAVNNKNKEIPSKYELFQNYPNPFNPVTTIKYAIPPDAKNKIRTVKLIVYDILGRKVKNLVNKQQETGFYEISFDGSHLTSGIYYYKIQAGEHVETRKMLILK